jgi:predicted phosphoribosyltransferase
VARRGVFADRADAGRELAAELAVRGFPPDAVVAGIPRGGVAVAAEVARARRVPLQAIVARKVGAPGHPELAVGAVGPDGVAVLDQEVLRHVGATDAWVAAAVEQVRAEVDARLEGFPGVLRAADVAGRCVLVVDDGVATGSTAAAVGRWLADAGAGRRVLALPVGPEDTVERLGDDYDDLVVLMTPPRFVAVGQWYRDFTQVSDETARRLLGA